MNEPAMRTACDSDIYHAGVIVLLPMAGQAALR